MIDWKEKFYDCLTPTGQPKRTLPTEKKTEIFIHRAKQLHGQTTYDYSKTMYGKTNMEKVCPDHGSFFQSPNTHLSGKGCLICAGKEKKSVEVFVSQAQKHHGNLFDYSKVDYVNTDTKVEIVCPIHGSFFQIPKDHIRGIGCAKCKGHNQSILYIFQYFVSEDLTLGYKVGITNNLTRRTKELKTQSPYETKLIKFYELENPRDLEKILHTKFPKVPNLGAHFDGATEILDVNLNELLEFTEELLNASI